MKLIDKNYARFYNKKLFYQFRQNIVVDKTLNLRGREDD